MLWIGDKYYSGEPDDVERKVPDLDRALAEVKGREATLSIHLGHHHDEDRGWGFGHDVVVEYADRGSFADILTFFAVTEIGRRLLSERPDWRSWSWTPMSENVGIPSTGTDAIKERLGGTVITGWVLAAENGRIDEDTTWCKRTLLFSTATSHVVMTEDVTTLH